MHITLTQVIGEKQADKIIDSGLQTGETRILIVLGLIVVVGVIVWASVYVPAKIKERAADREDRKLEREFQITKAKEDRALEEARARSAASIDGATSSLEVVMPHAHAILKLVNENLNRNCPGVKPPTLGESR